MNGNEKKSLVPRLRFPEFRGTVPTLPLDTIADFVSEKISIDKITPAHYVSTENLLSDFGGINPATKLPSVSSATSFRLKDILVSNIRPYLRKVWQADVCGGASNDVLVIRPTERVRPDYLAAILQSNFFIDYVMGGAKGVKMPRGEISMIRQFPVPYPCSAEQKKIADCLSSLNDLLTAEIQKLDALKKYKKGLLQQLLPREGETVPRLRFREFQNATEWERKTLAQLGELVSGLTYSPNDVRENGLLVLRSSNVQDGRIVLGDNVYVRIDIAGAKPSLPNDILICVRNGSKSLIGKNALIPEGMPPCTHGAFMTIFRSNSAKFMIQLFQTTAYENQVAADLGATINSINGNQLKKYTFLIPKPAEQKAIADFLTSLDELIAAQAQKIEALKTHKRGLVQQLFPVLNEVPA
ncbi:restriction endonuclease subunit S [Cronobacter sakazakii]